MQITEQANYAAQDIVLGEEVTAGEFESTLTDFAQERRLDPRARAVYRRATSALRGYLTMYPGESAEIMPDVIETMLADIRHLCDAAGVDFLDAAVLSREPYDNAIYDL